MSPPSVGSPSTCPFGGHFSDEDIHELLGAMDHPHLLHPVSEEQIVSCTPGSDNFVEEEARVEARVERKRSRERQRRSDVNKQFADLTALLRRIETEDLDDEVTLSIIPLGGPSNRVDLIARTIAVLERMHDMSTKRKREIIDLNRELEDMKKMAEDTAARLKEATLYQQGPSKPVMMMIPMMVNSPGAMQGGAAFQMPFMPQQPQMFMPQMAAAVTATDSAQMPQSQQMEPQMPPQMQPQTQPQMQQHMPQQPSQQMSQSQMHPSQQIQPQMPLMNFPPMIFGLTTTTAQAPADPAQPKSPQLNGQKQPANVNGGGNLAHCA